MKDWQRKVLERCPRTQPTAHALADYARMQEMMAPTASAAGAIVAPPPSDDSDVAEPAAVQQQPPAHQSARTIKYNFK